MPYGTADVLDVINTKFPLTGGGAAQEALDGLLCVQYDNSDSNGEFYEASMHHSTYPKKEDYVETICENS